MLPGVARALRPAVRLGALLSTLTPCLSVLAHGEPPAAYSVVSHDAQGARAVRLSAGVALRRAPQRFQFVCPAAWGDQYAAPLAALADGTIVVGATSGLKLLGADGALRAHPDPAALGDSAELVASERGVFSLRATPEGSELVAVDAQSVRVIWRDTNSQYSLAALDDKLLLLRASGSTLEQITIAAADGAQLDRQLAVLGSPVDYTYARATAGSAYALVMFRTMSVLGRVQMNVFTSIAQAELAIAGPLGVSDGTLLALDGKLMQLTEGGTWPLAESEPVLCLGQNAGLSYACNPDGIAAVSGQALGAPLFRLSWLLAPDLERLAPGEPRDDCSAQWQDLRVDLLAVGIALVEEAQSDPGGALDAGSTPLDAAITGEGVEAREAAVGDGGQEADPGSLKRSSSCQVRLGQRGLGGQNVISLALALLLLRIRRRNFELVHTNR
jgi:hypothetical protein